ncbi:RNA polymerase sigma factor SigB [Lysinibacillus xylanilyticus]|uniref:RNA polymerase sigma factor SigB n=1 Tax=Lysinibacillus xylanilyticus TaxID=582475 RepID=UPI002B25527F|nr:RNA polymerase sigma factor SigB [Lysinibacillus xylanilyticus]MEB2302491.1 RNA polymerase sigma factor SigB [Lysinibacillus xylanilyticus]
MSKESLHKSSSKEDILKWIALYQSTEDDEAQTNLVIHYRYLVESIARKYSNGKSSHDDITQVGMLGLLGAIRRFNPDVGRSFEAFAVPTIVGEIKRFLRDKTWDVHVPRRIKELGPRIKTTVEALTVELQRSPSIKEIADQLEVEEEEVLESMEMSRSYHALSMDHSIESDSDGSTVTLFDIMGKVDDGYEMTNKRMIVSEAMSILDERERQIIQLTYLEQLTQKEVGERLGVSQMHVSRIQRKAIKKLQEAILVRDGVSL